MESIASTGMMARKPRKYDLEDRLTSVESSVVLEVVAVVGIGVGEAVLGTFFGEEAPGVLTHW